MLGEIAAREGVTIGQLCARIAAAKPPRLSFTVAIRLAVLQYYRDGETERGRSAAMPIITAYKALRQHSASLLASFARTAKWTSAYNQKTVETVRTVVPVVVSGIGAKPPEVDFTI